MLSTRKAKQFFFPLEFNASFSSDPVFNMFNSFTVTPTTPYPLWRDHNYTIFWTCSCFPSSSLVARKAVSTFNEIGVFFFKSVNPRAVRLLLHGTFAPRLSSQFVLEEKRNRLLSSSKRSAASTFSLTKVLSLFLPGNSLNIVILFVYMYLVCSVWLYCMQCAAGAGASISFTHMHTLIHYIHGTFMALTARGVCCPPWYSWHKATQWTLLRLMTTGGNFDIMQVLTKRKPPTLCLAASTPFQHRSRFQNSQSVGCFYLLIIFWSDLLVYVRVSSFQVSSNDSQL